MAITEVPDAAHEARKARYRREVADLDYRRSIVRLKQGGLTQKSIAAMVGVAQPTVQKLLARAATVKMPAEGFAGADPYEICERYAAGLIDRAQLMDELTRWEYAPPARTNDYFDDLLFDAPGSTDDLERARRRGLIDEDTFYEVLDRIEPRMTAE
ncbi:hypothetical protein B4915_00880 [Leucobacter massiliensis]|uniref:Uncharacterized protein n=1 Tax=Leucobacter massiliensis TaxID=1686285 RepID=A0A2S9QSD0_9MICO|nr:hypothetical protein B4915_00880 [Leucobacter massiliensis]